MVGFSAVRAPGLLAPEVPPVYELPAGNGDGLFETTAFTDSSAGYIHLNTARAAELESLPGIGGKLAEAIVRYREEHGRFHSRSELMKVRGIGEKTYEKLKDRLLL